ncbi:E3 ubiquitin-protein ligase Mdm2-like [Lineus longissimus]|uniref:E3 ubiquitin-protein ligase Mdm2-like n=1 Tax=Lineus longissimus TaxID=88925 RepID=UPI00315D6B2E
MKAASETSPDCRKRRRRKRCPSSISFVSSDGEGPWAIHVVEVPSPDSSSDKLSVQSKETNWVRSSSDTIITDAELPVIDWDDDDNPPFTIEYEVRSPSSGDYGESDASSENEAHFRQEILVVCTDSDVEFFADYSESEDDESDPEIASDKWICGSCGDLNSPLSRYCLCCWKERPGWLPEMGRFRRSLSAPTGLPSSSASSSPPGACIACDTSGQPQQPAELPLPCDEILLESVAEISPVALSKSSEITLLSTAQSGHIASSSSSYTHCAYPRLVNSLVRKHSATSAGGDSVLCSGSQDIEISVTSKTPNPAGDMQSLSASSQPGSQESGVFDTFAAASAKPVFSSPLEANSQPICTRLSTGVVPFDDVDGPPPMPSFSFRCKALETNDSTKPIPCDIFDGFKDMDKDETFTVQFLDGLSVSQESAVRVQEQFSKPVIPAKMSLYNFDSVERHLKEPNPPSTSKQGFSERGQHSRVSQAGECPFCLKQSSNAVLIHGKTGHQVCCYKCARKLRRRGKPCPVCRKPIQKVIKNFII